VLPVDAINLSSILVYGGHNFGAGSVGGTGLIPPSSGGFDDYGGIDPNLDPDLAMAIRVSTEEARAREEAMVY
jgi:26S proteasome regulatory subunit N10